MAGEAPLIYAAHPMTTYGTPREARALARIAELAPHAEIVNPAARYRDSAHWQADWPRLLAHLSGLVVFGTGAGPSGRGAFRS
ncbi:MAG TPA: hypothetical protein VEH82_03450 [Acidimicrobiales bacterium]|nr:hypothetical protein [Acidimicrobiales bacterium]